MDLSPSTLRRLELHEAQAHAHAPREARDLTDAVLLTDPTEADPFLNRASALRLPADPARCDRRLAELYALFASLERRPHVWVWPGISTPGDLAGRMAADGFHDVGGTYAMALTGRPAPTALPEGARLERASEAGEGVGELLAGAARVMVEAFGAIAGSAEAVATDLGRAPIPAWDVCLVTIGGEPVAAGRRYTADGMTHLSSICTLPSRWGRGLAAAVTATLAHDGIRAGGPLVHLGLEVQNARAQRLYRRLGFEIVGGRIADLLL